MHLLKAREDRGLLEYSIYSAKLHAKKMPWLLCLVLLDLLLWNGDPEENKTGV
jgi:hypothetical protein